MRHLGRAVISQRRGAALALILVAIAVLALPALALADEPKYVVQNSATSCWNPDVSGDFAVWQDQGGYEDIWGRVLPSGIAFPIVQLSGSQQVTPAVDGNVVVWADERSSAGVYKIYGASVDLETGGVTEFPVSTTTGVKSDPDVSGRYVVWVNYISASNSYDIYGFDLLTQTEFPICTNVAKQQQPAISGDLVVWRDFRYNATNGDIYAARIGEPGHTINEFEVRAQPTGGNYVESQPAVHGSTVAWVDQRAGGNYRVYAATVTGTTVSDEWEVSQTTTRGVSAPAVNGSLIVWTYTGGTTYDDIYGRRLDRSAEFAIASTTQYERAASVSASRTVWGNSSTWDIYGADIGGFGWTKAVLIDGGAPYATARDVTLTLSGASSVGTATHMSFSEDGVHWSDWEAYATSRAYQLPSGDGTKTVLVRFRDAEDNVSQPASDTIVLDENAPQTDDDAPAGWSTGDVQVTLTAGDNGGSGVTGTVYDLDGAGNVTYVGPITVSGDGVHTLVYRSTDAVGHAEEPQVVEVKIDGTAPTTTDNAGDGWHASGFTLALEPYDELGLDRTEYSIDGGPWTTGTERTFTLSSKRSGAAREFVVEYRSVDLAGNVEETKTCTVRIDCRKPLTVDDYSGAPAASDVTVNLLADDAHSGVFGTWYSVDGADPVEGASVLVPAPSDGSNDGAHTIVYFSVDQVGNVESVRWTTVVIAAGSAL